MANPLRDRLNRHASIGYREIEARVSDMNATYLAARNRLEYRIYNYVKENRASFTGPRLVMLMEELSKEYNAFEVAYTDKLKYALNYVVDGYYRDAMFALGLRGNTTIAGGLSKDRIKLMMDDAFAHVAGATRNMNDYTIYQLRRISAQVMREATLTGESRVAVSRRLLAANTSGGWFQFVDRSGRKWTNEAYFDMLGRTLLHNNAREAYLQGCADQGSDIVTVSTSGDPCKACAALEGVLLSISGKTPGLMTVAQAIESGLFHPNCTHRLIAVPEAIAEEYYAKDGREKFSPQPDLRDSREVFKSTGFKTEDDLRQHNIAVDAIGKIHSMTGMPDVPVMREKENLRTPGAHGTTIRDLDTGYAERIEIYDCARDKAFTELHEMGHAIDNFLDLSHSATGKKLMDAIEKSDGFYSICEQEDQVRDWAASAFKQAHLSHLNYVTRQDELIARAYAQYIAEKSENETLLEQLGNQDKLYQWDSEDFVNIRKEFDAVLKMIGWLK